MSKALPLVVGDVAKETSFFAGIFDKFFDALNVSNFSNGTRLRKQFSHPYRTGDDERLKVHVLSIVCDITRYILYCA